MVFLSFVDPIYKVSKFPRTDEVWREGIVEDEKV